MNFSFQYSYDVDTKQYIASVPELWLSDYGDSIAEAETHLRDMIALYFEETATQNSSKSIYA